MSQLRFRGITRASPSSRSRKPTAWPKGFIWTLKEQAIYGRTFRTAAGVQVAVAAFAGKWIAVVCAFGGRRENHRPEGLNCTEGNLWCRWALCATMVPGERTNNGAVDYLSRLAKLENYFNRRRSARIIHDIFGSNPS